MCENHQVQPTKSCGLCKAAGIITATSVVIYLIKVYFSGAMNKAKRNMAGQVVVVTGANTGIGYETAKDLVLSGAQVIVASRDEKRGKDAEATLNKVKENSATFMKLDLADLQSVRLFANEFKGRFNKLDVLINNAGVMHPLTKQLTKDGFEMQMGTNHLGHFLLTNLLLDQLKKSEQFRVINVSSTAHQIGQVVFDDINYDRRPYNIITSYGASKAANILFTIALQKRIDNQKLNGIALSLHPGVVRTELTRQYDSNVIFGSLFKAFQPIYYFFTKSALQGAQTSLHLAYEKVESLKPGSYYSDCVPKKTGNKQITPQIAEELWDFSSKLVKL